MFSFSKSMHKHQGKTIQKWTFDAKSPLLSSATAVDIDDDGKKEIIFGTRDGRITCIDENAHRKWEYDLEPPREGESYFFESERLDAVHATPTIQDVNDDGAPEILFGTEFGTLFCLSNKGKLLWKYQARGAIRGRILVEDVDTDGVKEVLFGTLGGEFLILTAKGKRVSRVMVKGGVASEPTVYKARTGTQIIVGTEHDGIHSYDAEGRPLWRFATEGAVRAKPAFGRLTEEMNIVVGDLAGTLYCLDLRGKESWRFKTGGAIYGRSTIADIKKDGRNEVVVGSCDNAVYCLSDKGEKLWSYQTDSWIVSSPLVTDFDGDGNLEVVVGSYDHNLYVLDGEGTFNPEYIPGLAGIAHQAGHYTNIVTKDPVKHIGKRLWQIKTQGIILGCEELEKDNIIVNVRSPGHAA